MSVTRAILLVFSAVVVTAGNSAPARRGLMTKPQADGSEIIVRVVGDEHFHYCLSADSFLLAEYGGIYYYASVDSAGSIARTGYAAQSSTDFPDGLSSRFAHISSPDVTDALSKLYTAKRAARKRTDLLTTAFPSTGEQKSIVVIVDYQDETFTVDDPYDFFYRMLNEEGFSDYSGTGSAADYFHASSMDVFLPQFDVYGSVTLANDRSYYGANDSNGDDEYAWMMAVEACEQLDDSVDFAEYDNDGDGCIDNVFIIYAGKGENADGAATTVWPHSWYVSDADKYNAYTYDGVRLDRYACTCEWIGDRPDGIGTFVHEFSHVMGLPDLYGTGSSSPFTPGYWDVLDDGCYNNDACTPCLYGIFERYSLGWIEPYVIRGEDSLTIRSIQYNEGCIIPTDDENEFFLIENRQQVGWDEYIPGHGMLVWHIDYDEEAWEDNTVNNVTTHQRVDIEEADGKKTSSTRDGDAFPGTDMVTSFTDDTNPSMLTWDGTRLGLPITDITENKETITFNVAKGTGTDAAISVITSTDSAPISVSGRTLTVNAPDGSRLVVADTKGVLIYDGTTVSGERVTLPSPGVYAVNIAGHKEKITVK